MSDQKVLRNNATRAGPLVNVSPARSVQRYCQQFPKIISIEGWFQTAHPDAPALPWLDDQGEEVCSFAVVPLGENGGITVFLFDARGRELVCSGNRRAIFATCLALNTTPWELTFLPALLPSRAAALSSARMRARVRKPMESPPAQGVLPGIGSRRVPTPSA